MVPNIALGAWGTGTRCLEWNKETSF
jgi:hypothetical protein